MNLAVGNRVERGAAGAVLAALVLAGGAVGCSKSDSAQESPRMTPVAAVAKAAKNSERITSPHYRMTGTMPGAGRVPRAESPVLSTAEYGNGFA